MARRLLFATCVTVLVFGILLLGNAAWFVRMEPDDGLEALGPGLIWIGGTLLIAMSSPIWTWLIHSTWVEIRPILVRNLLLLPLAMGLAAVGAVSMILGLQFWAWLWR